MKDREDLLEIEIALLQAAGRRYGLLLERASRERRERIRKEARRAIEQARVKHGAGCPGRGQTAAGRCRRPGRFRGEPGLNDKSRPLECSGGRFFLMPSGPGWH